MLPTTQPPPWMYRTVGNGPSPGGDVRAGRHLVAAAHVDFEVLRRAGESRGFLAVLGHDDLDGRGDGRRALGDGRGGFFNGDRADLAVGVEHLGHLGVGLGLHRDRQERGEGSSGGEPGHARQHAAGISAGMVTVNHSPPCSTDPAGRFPAKVGQRRSNSSPSTASTNTSPTKALALKNALFTAPTSSGAGPATLRCS